MREAEQGKRNNQHTHQTNHQHTPSLTLHPPHFHTSSIAIITIAPSASSPRSPPPASSPTPSPSPSPHTSTNLNAGLNTVTRQPHHRRLAAILSVSERTVRDWLSRIDKDNKEARDCTIRDLWLACSTQEEIAEAVGMPQRTASEVLAEIASWRFPLKPGEFSEIADDRERLAACMGANRAAALYQVGFDPPLYNIWKQQEKTAGVSHSRHAPPREQLSTTHHDQRRARMMNAAPDRLRPEIFTSIESRIPAPSLSAPRRSRGRPRSRAPSATRATPPSATPSPPRRA